MNQNEKKTNTLAILGFIFSFLIAIVGLVLSILGLRKSKETGSGKGLSIAGIVISSVSIVMSILIMLLFIPYYFSYDSDIKGNEDSNTTVTDNVAHYSHTFYISPKYLYVDAQEQKYKDYARDTKIKCVDNLYYIEKDELYASVDGNVDVINLNGEKPKYLAMGTSCGGAAATVLTEEGNIYAINNPGTREYLKDAKIIYNKGNASEMILNRADLIFTTCSELSLYAKVDDTLYYIPSSVGYETNDNYKTREEVTPYSYVYPIYESDVNWINKLDYYSSILLYPDGSLNKYVYSYKNTEPKSDFVTDGDGNNILVSFIFNMNKEIYIVDINGYVYKIVGPDNYSEAELLPFTVERELSFDKKITSIDVDHTYKNNQQNDKIVLNYSDGNKKEYSTKNGDDIKFDYGYIQ